jgi:hypothetical protein
MATTNGGGRGQLRMVERDLRTPASAGVAGLVFAALFVVSILLLYKQPAQGSTAAEIAAWYLDNHARKLAVVGIYLVPFAGIAFLWFIAVIRAHIGEREDRFFATVFICSGVLFVAMMFAAAAAGGSSIAAVKFQGAPPPGPDTFVFARGLAYTFLYIYAVRAAAVFIISVSTLGLRTGTLPRWLVFLGYAVAVVQLVSVSYYKGIVLIFPAWVAIASVELLRAARAASRA